jgi:hypothetical protein
MQITCGCGHTDKFDAFCHTTLSGCLPPGQFQCPGCGDAWQRKESEYRIIRAGSEAMIIPGRVDIVSIERRL